MKRKQGQSRLTDAFTIARPQRSSEKNEKNEKDVKEIKSQKNEKVKGDNLDKSHYFKERDQVKTHNKEDAIVKLESKIEGQVKSPDPIEPEAKVEVAQIPPRKHLNPSDNKYQTYYDQLLSKRLTKPIHQDDMDIPERILRHFDLSLEYGPVAGITRLQRWQRAEKRGLNPPKIIEEILDTQQGSEETKYVQSYLYGQI